MKKLLLFAAIIAIGAVGTACSAKHQYSESSDDSAAVADSETVESITYEIAKNYFIRNDVDSVPEVVTSDADLQKFFGMAAYMGKDGQPSKIDFKKQFVIVASVPVTDIATEITPLSLKKDDSVLNFTCKIVQSEKQSYSTHPFVMIIVDKLYEAPVNVIWQK